MATTFDDHVNLVRTTLAIDILAADTDMVLTTGEAAAQGMPTANFTLLLWPQGQAPTQANSEYVRVATRVGDLCDPMTRGAEGSTPRNFPAGTQVALVPTNATFQTIEDAITSLEGGLFVATIKRVDGINYPLSFAGIRSACADASAAGGGTVIVDECDLTEDAGNTLFGATYASCLVPSNVTVLGMGFFGSGGKRSIIRQQTGVNARRNAFLLWNGNALASMGSPAAAVAVDDMLLKLSASAIAAAGITMQNCRGKMIQVIESGAKNWTALIDAVEGDYLRLSTPSSEALTTGATVYWVDPTVRANVKGFHFVGSGENYNVNTAAIYGYACVGTETDNTYDRFLEAAYIVNNGYSNKHYFREMTRCGGPGLAAWEIGATYKDTVHSPNNHEIAGFGGQLRYCYQFKLIDIDHSDAIGYDMGGDTFNRANSAVTPGSLDSGPMNGVAWTVVTGTWGIDANRAYVAVNPGNAIMVADFGRFDSINGHEIKAQFSVIAGAGIVFRYVDASNFWIVVQQNLGWELYKVVAGVYTLISSWATTPTNGDRVTVFLTGSGNTVTIIINDVVRMTSTDVAHIDADKIGLGVSGTTTTMRCDYLQVHFPGGRLLKLSGAKDGQLHNIDLRRPAFHVTGLSLSAGAGRFTVHGLRTSGCLMGFWADDNIADITVFGADISKSDPYAAGWWGIYLGSTVSNVVFVRPAYDTAIDLGSRNDLGLTIVQIPLLPQLISGAAPAIGDFTKSIDGHGTLGGFGHWHVPATLTSLYVGEVSVTSLRSAQATLVIRYSEPTGASGLRLTVILGHAKDGATSHTFPVNNTATHTTPAANTIEEIRFTFTPVSQGTYAMYLSRDGAHAADTAGQMTIWDCHIEG